ncbi:phosphomethylpyrimidine synthase ThiC [Peptoniphilus asaccharolyticus]
MKYKTQMEAAKAGFVTDEMRVVAQREGLDVEFILNGVKEGKIAIPANKNHKRNTYAGVGKGLKTKINVNLGISRDCPDVECEIVKVKEALNMKADAIMDLSSFGKTEQFRKRLVEVSDAMVGTVPIYDAVGFYDKELQDITAEEFLDVVRKHGENGVDFVTIHAGVNLSSAEVFKRNPRLLNIVSRGGSLTYAWMELNKRENPYFEYYDQLLDICAEYDITISLGDGMRPGCLADGTDASQIHELILLGELAKRAWDKNVQVMIEGPGHIQINDVETNIKLAKKLTHEAPLYVLGPLVTDVAPGYDHITSAIGGAIAAAAGVDFLCYVTPAEHLRLPTLDDMREGIIACRIAAHSGDIAKGVKGAFEWDRKMGEARRVLDWDAQFELSMDPEKCKRYREESVPMHGDSCTMCGKMCSVRNMNRIMDGKDINILRAED